MTSHKRGLYLILSGYFTLHFLLFLFVDLPDPNAIYRADRAELRHEKIQFVFLDYERYPFHVIIEPINYPNLFDDPTMHDSFGDRFLLLAQPGDYFIHGLLWYIGGPYFVIFSQIILGSLGMLFFYKLTCLYVRHTVSVVATLFFILLPTNIIEPHQLVTEAIFVPLIIMYIYFIILYLRSTHPKNTTYLFLSASIVACAVIMRYQMLFVPLFLALTIIVLRRMWYHGMIYALVGYTGIIFMVIANFSASGDFSLGQSDVNLGRLLQGQANIIHNMAQREREHVDNISDFTALVWENKGYYLYYRLQEMAALFFNPGTSQLFGRYMNSEWFQLSQITGWVGIRKTGSSLEILKTMFQQDIVWILITTVSMLARVALMSLALWGFITFLRNKNIILDEKVTLLGVFFLTMMMLQLPILVRIGHRGGIEFLLMIWAAIAAGRLYQLWTKRVYGS